MKSAVLSIITLALLSSVPANTLAAEQRKAGDEITDPESGIRFVYIPPGCFAMGSTEGFPNEQPVHDVCIEKGFWLGKYEVTQGQFMRVMLANPSKWKGDNRPVELVSWDEAVSMADELSYQSGKNYRLPTEAEWEYACTAGGKHSRYCGDGAIEKLAWYKENSFNETHSVGSLRPNAWGLHDMSGNVWEWVQDCVNVSYPAPPFIGSPCKSEAPGDGSAWLSGDCYRRVHRGGTIRHTEPALRATFRYGHSTDHKNNHIGFRLALDDWPLSGGPREN